MKRISSRNIFCERKDAPDNHTSRPKGLDCRLEHPEKNTTECCQVCSIAEDIVRAEKRIGTTGLGQACWCQWKERFTVDFTPKERNNLE